MPVYEAQCAKCEKVHTYWSTIQDRDVTPPCCGGFTAKILSPTKGTVDIQPYMTVVHDKETGKPEWITSRKSHRDFVRRNGFEEVGNESTIPKDARSRIEENRYIRQELDDSVDALP